MKVLRKSQAQFREKLKKMSLMQKHGFLIRKERVVSTIVQAPMG